MLLAYELVPEAYRQRFRGYRRSSGQSYVEFQREKEILVDRWVRSLKVDMSYESLRELVLMEEFKKSTTPEARTYLEDQKVREVRSAAVAADSYELTHKVKPGSPPSQRRHSNPGSPSMRRWQSSYNEGGNRPQGVRENHRQTRQDLGAESVKLPVSIAGKKDISNRNFGC